MEILLTRLSYLWLVFVFTGLGIKFYKISHFHVKDCDCDHLRAYMSFMFFMSALAFTGALLNTLIFIDHYPLYVGVIMTGAVLPFWSKLQ